MALFVQPNVMSAKERKGCKYHMDFMYKSKPDKSYIGVRVRMPVRDILKNIRIAKGIDPKGTQSVLHKMLDHSKVLCTLFFLKTMLNAQSLEELSIIAEVLEEDLKTTSLQQPHKDLCCFSWPASKASLSEEFFLDKSSPQAVQEKVWDSDFLQDTSSLCFPGFRPSFTSFSDGSGGYSSDESEDLKFCFKPHEASSSDGTLGSICNFSTEPLDRSLKTAETKTPYIFHEEWENVFFFWVQVEWENSFLKSITNQDLLVPDKNGKMMLHQFVEQGRRAPVYVIAKRMAGMEKLDVRDEEGKGSTALHLAAERNQHLMVSDLLCLGANVNKRDMYGKTCFHLSAENGYVRVLEVLDKFMKGGLHVDMEIKDCNGLTALQSASVALGSTGRAVEQTKDPSQTQLQTLRHHQMIETLECLLKMEGTMHHLVSE
uniref:OCA domain-containing protein n=1 Tax=Denticeps clupeoides TaxID=299321 RepID=A0AAY4CVN9_9TELE